MPNPPELLHSFWQSLQSCRPIRVSWCGGAIPVAWKEETVGRAKIRGFCGDGWKARVEFRVRTPVELLLIYCGRVSMAIWQRGRAEHPVCPCRGRKRQLVAEPAIANRVRFHVNSKRRRLIPRLGCRNYPLTYESILSSLYDRLPRVAH